MLHGVSIGFGNKTPQVLSNRQRLDRRGFLKAFLGTAAAWAVTRQSPAQNILPKIPIPPPRVPFAMPPVHYPTLQIFTQQVDELLDPENQFAKTAQAYLKASQDANQREPELEKALKELLDLNPLNRPRHLRPIVKIHGGKVHEPHEVKQKMDAFKRACTNALAKKPDFKPLQALYKTVDPNNPWGENHLDSALRFKRRQCFENTWMNWKYLQNKDVKVVAARLAKQKAPQDYLDKQVQLYRAQMYWPILQRLEENAVNLEKATRFCKNNRLWEQTCYQEFDATGFRWDEIENWLSLKDKPPFYFFRGLPDPDSGYYLPFYVGLTVQHGKQLKQQGVSLPPDLTDPDFFPEIKATVQQAPRIQQPVVSANRKRSHEKAGS